LNGIGKLLVEAITQRDYTMVQSLVLLTSFVFILINFLVDLVNAFLDPRIRYQ
jgi:ABC-type dipeptide/oligopeptide/nickel transport system permease component